MKLLRCVSEIETPLSEYNPDWAIIKHQDKVPYLARETKATRSFLKLRTSEAEKLRCGQRHFEAIGVHFAVAVTADEVLLRAQRAMQGIPIGFEPARRGNRSRQQNQPRGTARSWQRQNKLSKRRNNIQELASRVVALQEQARALGLFPGDRELLECPKCGLMEDVKWRRINYLPRGCRKRGYRTPLCGALPGSISLSCMRFVSTRDVAALRTKASGFANLKPSASLSATA